MTFGMQARYGPGKTNGKSGTRVDGERVTRHPPPGWPSSDGLTTDVSGWNNLKEVAHSRHLGRGQRCNQTDNSATWPLTPPHPPTPTQTPTPPSCSRPPWTRTSSTHARHTRQAHTSGTHVRHARQARTPSTHVRHARQTRTSSTHVTHAR